MSTTDAKRKRLRARRASLIPKEWRRAVLADIVGPPQYGLSFASTSDGNCPIIGMRDLVSGRVVNSGWARVSVSAKEIANYRLNTGDLILNRTNSHELVGKLAIWNREEQAVFASYLVRFAARRDIAIPEYVVAALSETRAHRAIRRLVTTGVSQANINPSVFYEQIEINLPPLDEQRRIADALAIWDRAIETAEALAAAKQARTSALAARLVWNDDDPWVSLEELLAQSTKRVGPDLNPPIFSVSKEGLSPQEDRFNKRIANEDLSRHMLVLPGQLALSGLNFWLGSVAVSEEPGPICISPDYKVFTLSGLVDSRFFKHVVRSKPFRDLLIACSTERASIVRRNFNRDLFFASEIPLPAPEIQVKRAALLEALLQDVRLAEQRLESLRTQKLGLMQKLLTGEWRVPVGASEQAA